MAQYNSDNLVIHPYQSSEGDLIVEVTPGQAGWNTINFQARRLQTGQQWSFSVPDSELALVVLSGTLSVTSSRGAWNAIGKRGSVFTGLPYALYLPPDTPLTITAETNCEFALAWAKTTESHPPQLITPADVIVEIRGGDNATRHINSIIPPGFNCARLVIVEVYTPGGNWSSYPPHKHDSEHFASDGNIIQADLDEIYYYKIDRPEGYALQRIYTDASSPLAQSGTPIDAVVLARNNDVVLIPEGYHPVASPPGYTTYYLNVLVGSAQSLAAEDDPDFAWVKASYKDRDPRVPIFDVSQAKGVRYG